MELNVQQNKVVEWAIGGHPLEQTQDMSKVCYKCSGLNDLDKYASTAFGPSRKGEFCFNCNFWYQWVVNATMDDYKESIVRVGGAHYFIEPEDNTHPKLRGYAGSKFVIAFHDGREVTTRNLWFQGHIPSVWQNELPDNATFKED